MHFIVLISPGANAILPPEFTGRCVGRSRLPGVAVGTGVGASVGVAMGMGDGTAVAPGTDVGVLVGTAQ